MCSATLNDAGVLMCRRSDPHEAHKGCVYHSQLMTDGHHDDQARGDD